MYTQGAPDGAQDTAGSRMIARLAKSFSADNEHPGFSFPYRGCHTAMWRQMQTLIKYDNSWREKRTWKYNTVNPGIAYTSLFDRIEKDDVFRLNIILDGGWTPDTLLFLPRLVAQARDQKEWNRKCDHLSFADRRAYYLRRSERFKKLCCDKEVGGGRGVGDTYVGNTFESVLDSHQTTMVATMLRTTSKPCWTSD